MHPYQPYPNSQTKTMNPTNAATNKIHRLYLLWILSAHWYCNFWNCGIALAGWYHTFYCIGLPYMFWGRSQRSKLKTDNSSGLC
jgi:hypothetical protein